MGDDMDWDEIWDNLGNGKNWGAEKYRAQSTLLGVRDFHKHWDRYAPSSYFFLLDTFADNPKLQLGFTAQTSRMDSEGRFGTCACQ